jgi:PAS domain S-box-containing protein
MCEKLDKIEKLTNELSGSMEFIDKLFFALNSSNEGIAILDKEGKYIYLNKAHEEMFKYNEGEMLGKTWEILYTDEQVKYFIENVFPEIAKEGKWNGKDVAIAKDGSLVKEIVYLTALPDGGLVCTCIKDEN